MTWERKAGDPELFADAVNGRMCSVCRRVMSPAECGDELPEERVCDRCAGTYSIVGDPDMPRGFTSAQAYAEWLRVCLRADARKPGFYIWPHRVQHLKNELQRLEKAGY